MENFLTVTEILRFSVEKMTEKRACVWHCAGRQLDLTHPLVMGIVNVTPDSFSDGGTHNAYEAAVAWGQKLIDEGADILDVGGESTRPGAADVSVEDELERVIPVVRELADRGYTVSVDTSKPEVMKAAVEAGAAILNDVRSFELPGALEVAASCDAGLVIMHMVGTPRTMQKDPHYDDLLGEVVGYLQKREAVLTAAGIAPERICWDAGFGFGKTFDHNFSLLKHTDVFVNSERPYLAGLSRKTCIGAATGVKEAKNRVVGSVAAAILAVERGAQIVRVHDVAATKEALAVYEALKNAR